MNELASGMRSLSPATLEPAAPLPQPSPPSTLTLARAPPATPRKRRRLSFSASTTLSSPSDASENARAPDGQTTDARSGLADDLDGVDELAEAGDGDADL